MDHHATTPRAIRRCGELLKLIPRGDEATRFGHEGTHPPVITRTEAAREAGLSEFQKVTALRVATIPAPDFEAAVEQAAPPTVIQLAEQGKQSRTDTAPMPQPLHVPVRSCRVPPARARLGGSQVRLLRLPATPALAGTPSSLKAGARRREIQEYWGSPEGHSRRE